MSILGPRWIYATIFGTLEIGFTAAVIYALAHPLLLAKYVVGGKFAKASTLSAVETASQKIQSRRGKLSTDAIDEGGAEISPGSEGTAEDSLDSEGGADDLPNPEGGAEDYPNPRAVQTTRQVLNLAQTLNQTRDRHRQSAKS